MVMEIPPGFKSKKRMWMMSVQFHRFCSYANSFYLHHG